MIAQIKQELKQIQYLVRSLHLIISLINIKLWHNIYLELCKIS